MWRLFFILALFGALVGLFVCLARERKARAVRSCRLDVLRWVGVTGTKRVPTDAPHPSLALPEESRPALGAPEVLPVNCVHEEYVQVKLAKCACGGAYRMARCAAAVTRGRRKLDVVEGACRTCGGRRKFYFDAGKISSAQADAALRPTTPSKLMDVLGWFGLATSIEQALPPNADAVRGQALKEIDFALEQALLFYEMGSSILIKGACFEHPDIENPRMLNLPTRPELEARRSRIRDEMQRLLH